MNESKGGKDKGRRKDENKTQASIKITMEK